MKVRYSVTFEFDLLPPKTHRSTIAASNASTCFARTVRESQKALYPKNWTSVVCVLLERLEDETNTKEESDGTTTTRL